MPDRAFNNRSDDRSSTLKRGSGQIDDTAEYIHQAMMPDRIAAGLAMVMIHDFTSLC